jgi:uncharacterized lipoprotein YddW (UPF0748 family)
MFKSLRKTLSAVGFTAAALAFAAVSSMSFAQEKEMNLPEPMREFRGVWVATVANIDWPTTRYDSVEKQKADAIRILDRARELNMNAIVFQVRPSADALYKSDLEPWSEYLTGKAGVAPDPYYDPLEFWIEESHKRGLQLHAWFNPYRAYHPNQKSPIPESHVVKKRPDLAKKYGEYYWLDPAEPDVQKISLDVMLDVTRRYDVDGIHMDDYFYPYKSYGDNADFPDDESYKKYKDAGGTLARDDFRRKAVDDFVEALYKGIKEIKPEVQFGLSPFGIWRPGYPEGITGLDQYSELYADAKLWLNEGWVDYWTPQLYWPITRKGQEYEKLLKWWVEQNTHNRHVWPGNAGHSIGYSNPEFQPIELINEIKLTREIKGATGNVFFSMVHFMPSNDPAERRMIQMMMQDVYAKEALPPVSPWLDKEAPAAPQLSIQDHARPSGGYDFGSKLIIEPGTGEEPFQYVLYTKENGKWDYQLVTLAELPSVEIKAESGPATSKKYIPISGSFQAVAVTAVDDLGNQSKPASIELPK